MNHRPPVNHLPVKEMVRVPLRKVPSIQKLKPSNLPCLLQICSGKYYNFFKSTYTYLTHSGEQAKRAAQEKVEAQAAQQAAMQAIETESKQKAETEPPAVAQINFGAYGQRAVSFLARNFYNLKYLALVLAFCINFMLLFYKVSSLGEAEGSGSKGKVIKEGSGGSEEGSGSGEDSSEEDVIELVHVDEDFYYMMHVMCLAALLHSIVSLAMLIAYYHLKVPPLSTCGCYCFIFFCCVRFPWRYLNARRKSLEDWSSKVYL